VSGFGDRLREERERMGLTQGAVSTLVDSTKRTVQVWESGGTAPNAHHLAALEKRGFDLVYLVTGHRPEEMNESLTPQESEWLEFFRSMTGKPEAQQLMIDFMRMTKANK